MFASLRTRLFVSYVVVIGLTLCIIGLALLVILQNSPAPINQEYRRLGDIARASMPYMNTGPEQINERLAEIAASNDIRIIRLALDDTVLFDSDASLPVGQRLTWVRIPAADAPGIQRGEYAEPDGQNWLILSLEAPLSRPEVGRVLLAIRRPRAQIFSALGESLLTPLLQAGAISLIVSVVLAIAISNSVARPLRRIASSAHALADGEYDHKAPEEGPREVRELGRAFNAMSQQLQRSQQTQRDFLANVSHELKTPLTSIQGYAQAIIDRATQNSSQAAQVIFDEAARMRRMVEDLLDLARIESGHASVPRDFVNIGQLLEAVAQNFALRAEAQGVVLTSDIGELPQLTGDSDRLAQVFNNLIDNALAHTPKGGHVTVGAVQINGGVQVSVTDTGKGIPADDLERIFERFYQADKSRARAAQKGTGLGLTITREIVLGHGGLIRAESGRGDGAIFVVWLPLPRPSDETVSRRKPDSR